MNFRGRLHLAGRLPAPKAPEHYVNLPRSAKGIEVAHPCPVACVVSAILNDTRDLALSLDVSDQLRLLKSLGHWVGDIHQPMHVSFEDDRGANNIAIEGPCRFNLHAVWDTCIIEKKIGLDYADLAEKLRAEITDEDRALDSAYYRHCGRRDMGPRVVSHRRAAGFAILCAEG